MHFIASLFLFFLATLLAWDQAPPAVPTTHAPEPGIVASAEKITSSSPKVAVIEKAKPKVEAIIPPTVKPKPLPPPKTDPVPVPIPTPEPEPSLPPADKQEPEPREHSISAAAIISLSNNERQTAGLTPLSRNSKLDAIAQGRLDDMFAEQYFAHDSPTGADAQNLSEKFNYAYSRLGENIARGDYSTAEKIVQGWMQSLGHRANILHKDYTEIGVAVRYGSFNGHDQWIAVQIFGRPF